MDPVTSAIVAGAATGLGKTATTAIVDSYKALKGLFTEKFGQDNDLLDAVRSLEKKPDSKSRQGVVEENVVDTGADQDRDILTVADKLLAQVKNIQQIASVTGDGAIAQGDGTVAVGKGGVVVKGDVNGNITVENKG